MAAYANRQRDGLLSSLAGLHQVAAIARVASYAREAVLTELMLTPKPGLVDRRNSGAHCDMNFDTFCASASAIAPWWPQFVEIGYAFSHLAGPDFLAIARPAGIECEREMFRATRGVNTHKGAIFSLGLLCCAAGRLLAKGNQLSRENLCAEVAGACAGLIDRELRCAGSTTTAGERTFKRYGLPGARGEAATGFALVREVALPVYDQLRSEGVGEEIVLLQVLLHLLAENDDTNLISRGGLAGLRDVRERARNLLNHGGVLGHDGLQKMEQLDDQLIARHLSPGGSADLLAVTWFLAQFPIRPAAFLLLWP